MEYSNEEYNKEDLSYFIKEELDKYFEVDIEKLKYKYIYTDPNFCVDPNNSIPYPIDISDLVRLHRLIRSRKCFNVLEYGTGYSSIIIADALYKNKKDYEEYIKINNSTNKIIRCNNKFELHCVDSEKVWFDNFNNKIKNIKHNSNIKDIIHTHFSEAEIGTFNDRICHFYKNNPDIVPDFIYLDGPSPSSVNGNINNISFQCLDRTNIAGDLLKMEPTFIPGLLILIDGRTNNALFLKNNFQKKYIYNNNFDEDYHTFELIDNPLGKINLNKLEYCNILK